MSTDPREFEHPIDGTGGTVTPEAIEAAAKALYALEPWQIASYSTDTYAWKALTPGDRYNYYRTATAALTAAAPLIAAQAKAEALREAADACAPDYETTDTRSVAKWLRARAAAIEPTA